MDKTAESPLDLATTATAKRSIVAITRTEYANGTRIIDAVADDGTAWFMLVNYTENNWTQLPPLPDKEFWS